MAETARLIRREPIPVARPRLPPAASVEPYLRQIDANARYANFGPLQERLQHRLAEFWGVGQDEVALLSSATAALTLSLLAQDVKHGMRCLLPSWTFAASAGAVVAAGLVPHFVDVCPGTWSPNPAEIAALARRGDVGAMLVVCPFGAPIDLAAWDRLASETGVPLVVDGAAAFDTLREGGPMQVGRSPVAVSLHATKVFGIGEGGALICRDQALVRRVRALAQFGFLGTREATVPGINAKLSEYAAAVGLAGLDLWAETRARWMAATRAYAAGLPAALTRPPGFALDWVASTLTVLWPDARAGLAETLAAAGVATLNWWGPGCHAHAAYRDYPAEDLPVTRHYAPRALGLPFFQDLSAAQIETVCTALDRLLRPQPVRPRTRALRAAVA